MTIAGKYCESGDILIRDAELPRLWAGDILAIPVAGAYCLSMASNYNGSLKPAVRVRQGRPSAAGAPSRDLRRPHALRCVAPGWGEAVWTIIGQERAVAVLTQGLSQERLSHAYLFAAPPKSASSPPRCNSLRPSTATAKTRPAIAAARVT